MLVVDTSAMLAAIAADDPPAGLRERLAGGDLHAPHLIDTEALHGLRRLVRRGEISAQRAEDARARFAELAVVRYPHRPLSDRIWELRHNLTAYDATFVALAEALGAPLLTCDRRLAAARGHAAAIDTF